MPKDLAIHIFISKYLKSLEVSPNFSSNTLRAYSSDLMQLFQVPTRLKKEQKEGVEFSNPCFHLENGKSDQNIYNLSQWTETLKESLRNRQKSPSSHARQLSTLRGFLLWLHQEHDFQLDIHLDTPFKKGFKIPHFLSVDEIIALADHLKKARKGDKKAERQRLLFYLLYGGGIRVSEACKLAWSGLDLGKGQVILEGKGGRERLIVFPPKTSAVIQELGCHGDYYIWGEKPLPVRTAYQAIRDLGKSANLFKPLHPHALRHSYATHLLASGADLRVIQQLLGHTSLAATEIYTHIDTQQLAQSLESFHPLSKKSISGD